LQAETLIVSPSDDPKAVVEAAILRPDLGLGAVVYAQASMVPDYIVIEAAKRGANAWAPETGGGATLRSFIERIALAVRQAGEVCEIDGLRAARSAGDGRDFAPDRNRHACGFCLEGAFVHIAGKAAEIAAVGRCAVLRWRPGAIEPLHLLHTVAALRSADFEFPSEHAHDIVTSVLARDPDNLLMNLTELRIELAADERLVLLSPSLATRVVGRGVVPPGEANGTPGALLEWLRGQVPPLAHGTVVVVRA
jgi:hypothetical protein